MGEDWIRRVSVWRSDQPPTVLRLNELSDHCDGFPWFEIACDADRLESVLAALGPHCPGLTRPMLEDLLTPDEEPEGRSFGEGEVRLASSFGVIAWRRHEKRERGTPQQGVGFLEFQPVELLAGEGWLITCWHPRRIFQGPEKVDGKPAAETDDLFQAVAAKWRNGRCGNAGDLGVSIMHELALSYAPAHRELLRWLEDWELGLYTEDRLDNNGELPELWGLMAVLRNWLNPLNKPGLRADLTKSWLPSTDHKAVIEVDERIDKALDALSKLSATMRQSFGLLHLEQTEEQRRDHESTQHRVELIAAAFLVPTLIVGFYGANTWVPGQGKHWGFWVMVGVLVVLGVGAVVTVVLLQRRSAAVAKRATEERARMRSELLRHRA